MDEAQIGRRNAERFSLGLPAELLFAEGAAKAVVLDISRTGARIFSPVAALAGTSVILKWSGHEAEATMVWAELSHAGLSFAQPIPHHVLQAMRLGNARKPLERIGEHITFQPERVTAALRADGNAAGLQERRPRVL